MLTATITRTPITETTVTTEPGRTGFSRRGLLTSAAAAGGAGLVGATTGFALGRGTGSQNTSADDGGPPRRDLDGANGPQTEPFYGTHQSGVETPPQAYAHFIAFTLRPGIKAAEAVRWLRLLTADAAALTQGQAPLADSESELAVDPARLTVTFGFGAELVALAGKKHVPDWLQPLEAFSIDRLDQDRCKGDLLLQICGDDPLTLAHARRMLFKDSRSFAEVAWQRDGFRRAYGSTGEGKTQRNLFGQLDGTANPGPGSEDFARIIWGQGTETANPVFSARGEPPVDLGAHLPVWMRGGTTLVLRDIAMNLDTWDQADRPAREFSVGRTVDNGAPLSGKDEFDVPDFTAVDERGLTTISQAAHIARARDGLGPEVQIHRRTFNYETGAGGDSGLLFASFQADIERQFLPIQRRLAEVDLLNEWTTPIGSTVWAIPPGATEGGYVGQGLFEG
ncbi:dye decolorizing peroxidase [Brevibacterium iodinum ATCC 49514]|uniref:Dye decolorizing peroxidase n=1 Tax=Brevibacterium iodinum ATCC 49514 TaxID=1255616 RepID=A0A2H1JR28_9MICO|nr:dye decolorizing peroxidase [Brevibacterium iodinum ATCC 49514]SUW13912.1 Probable deferrochelatase/peroxidase EfeN precursor [Brevibacterium iodinum]